MNRVYIFAALLSTGVVTSAVEAHHSFSMFDASREEVIEGTVARWAYNSPHTLLFLKDGAGRQWVFEGAAPPALLLRTPPMSGTTFTPGQHVIVVHCPLRDGRDGGGIGLVLADDGTLFNPSDGGCSANQRNAEWPTWIKAGHKSRTDAESKSPAAATP
jgi:Family of unknown function (DUF6152)